MCVCVCVYVYVYVDIYIYKYVRLQPWRGREGAPCSFRSGAFLGSCRDGGNTFTPERYRLELKSAHTFTGRQAPSDPHTVSGVFFLRKKN